jgi:hypothetical protein
MTTIKFFLRQLGAHVRKEVADHEIEDELRLHIEMRTRDNIAAGMTPEDAVIDAMRRFGDFDHIRAICEEIRKEWLIGVMKVVKGLAWIIIGCGLTLKLTADEEAWQPVGNALILIASLWRLLIHLREIRPSQRHIRAAQLTIVGGTHTIGDFSAINLKEQTFTPVPAYDKAGRTPVERLLSDEE